MTQQEQVFFTDHAVYISSACLVLRRGGTYPLTSLAQVTFGKAPGRRGWIGFLIFGLLLLAPGILFSQNTALASDSVVLTDTPYLVIGGLLLLISFASVLFQVTCPLYVVVLKGTFGTAKPIQKRNRRYVISVVEALNLALSKRDMPVPTTAYHIGQVVHDMSSHRSNDIIIGSQAQISGNIGNNNVQQRSDPLWSVSSPPMFNGSESSLRVLSDSGSLGPVPSLNRTGPTNSAGQKVIISYSHLDSQWLRLIRTHLAPLEHQQMIALWDDTQIITGMHTQQAMIDALKAADFALLLVSANFLASNIIRNYELPQMLQRLARGRFTVLPLLLSPCLYNESPLGAYQSFNPNSPLSMLSPAERDELLVKVARKIKEAIV